MSNQPIDREIVIQVNGEPQTIPAGLNLRGLLVHLKLDPDRLAVELNRAIIRKPEWDTTIIDAGAKLEIVTFVGGGRA